MYSKSAMPQLASAATYHARVLRFRRCAYHANVMKRFERISSPAVRRTIGIVSALPLRRVSKNNMRWLVIAAVAVCTHALGAQSPATGHANLGDSVLADLARLSDLERAYFAANGQYTSDLNALNFKPVTSAVIAVSYASARTFSASASHARLAPFLCFVIASATDGPEPERPFCTNSRYGTAAAALARAGTAADS